MTTPPADAADAFPARDPGLQGERTALSWSRTALVIVVNALLSLRSGFVSDQPALIVVGVILIGAAIAAVIYGNHRGRALSGHTRHLPTAAPALALALAAATTLLACAAGIASVLVAH
ncbi:DUF202 domain-containing protein [Leifsonia poae]|uniref:DUF202 domain-containing protein n=1 Tax=Leifsonia poae TaxID=110933 RepID=A0A9W6H5Z7_9MICO|nr:DUF202 domain-containing protein [Leifsonia poae]GLJ74586.1 hypothetical protein GCM10017584_01590 [Leifsonia poae]